MDTVKHQYRFDPAIYNTHWLLLQEVPENSRVLEIGSASGYMGEFMIKEKKCEVWGVEPENGPFEESKKYGYTKLFNTTAEEFLKLPEIANEKFDVIFLGDVLEHLVDPVGILQGLRQLLKPTGRFVISLPNVGHWSARLRVLKGNFDMDSSGIFDRTHLHFYTLKTMIEMIEAGGLKVVKSRHSGGGWERFGINKLFGIGQKILRLFPKLLSYQYVLVATLKDSKIEVPRG